MSKIIIKEAQKKSFLKTLKRNLSPKNIFRYISSSEYRQLYDIVEQTDNEMRDTAKYYGKILRDIIHNVRMSFKNREYAQVLYYTMQLLQTIHPIFAKIDNVKIVRDRIVAEFNSKSGVSRRQKEELEAYLGRPQAQTISTPQVSSVNQLSNGDIRAPIISSAKLLKATVAPSSLTKEADVFQWIKENIPTSTQISGDILDTLVKNKSGKQKEAARESLKIAEDSYNSINELFKSLESNLSDFSSYISIVDNFNKKLHEYYNHLSILYNENFQDLNIKNEDLYPQNQPYQYHLQQPVEGYSYPQQPQEEAYNYGNIELDTDNDGEKAANEVISLLKKVANNEDKGVSIALLCRASEICDEYDCDEYSEEFLNVAKSI